MNSVSYSSGTNDTIREITIALFNKLTNITVSTFSIRSIAITGYGTFAFEFPLYGYSPSGINNNVFTFFTLSCNYNLTPWDTIITILHYDATSGTVRLSRNSTDATSDKPGTRTCILYYIVLR